MPRAPVLGSKRCACGRPKGFYVLRCQKCKSSENPRDVCPKCGKREPETKFYKRAGRNRFPCAECVKPARAVGMKRYRKKHPDKVLVCLRAWHAKNPEYERSRSKKRYATDPVYRGRVRRSAKAFNKAHPEYMKNAAKLRRARMAGVECTLTNDEARELFEEYSGLCVYCSKPATTIDHVIPISAGGAHSKANCAPACKPCNSAKGAKSLIVWMATRRAA